MANGRVLDEIGRLILAELQQDARLSAAELGRRVGLSPPAAAERVRKMEEAGLIGGYCATVDPARLGFVTAFLRLKAGGRSGSQALTAVTDMPEVVECYRTSGADWLVAKVVVTDLSMLEQVIDRLSEFGTVATDTVLSTVVPPRRFGLQPTRQK